MNEQFNEEKYGAYSADSETVYKLKIFEHLNKVQLDKAGNVLDIGCSDGSTLEKIGGEFKKYGIEISTKACERAKKKGIDAVVLNLNENNLPYEDGFFDVVIMSEVLEHLFDTDRILTEILRVLKKGGILCITVPNIAKHRNRINLLFGKKLVDTDYHSREDSSGHIRVYSTDLLCEQLVYNRFEIVSKRASFSPHKTGIGLVDRLFWILGDWFPNLGDHAVIIAKKTSGKLP